VRRGVVPADDVDALAVELVADTRNVVGAYAQRGRDALAEPTRSRPECGFCEYSRTTCDADDLQGPVAQGGNLLAQECGNVVGSLGARGVREDGDLVVEEGRQLGLDTQSVAQVEEVRPGRMAQGQ
jgi:hypothetical protein